jgi:hypothetical protein
VNSPSAVQRDAKLFFEANREFDRIQRVEAEAAADQRLVVGNLFRLAQVGPEEVGHELL